MNLTTGNKTAHHVEQLYYGAKLTFYIITLGVGLFINVASEIDEVDIIIAGGRATLTFPNKIDNYYRGALLVA